MRKFYLFLLFVVGHVLSLSATDWTDENGVTWSFTAWSNDDTRGASLIGMSGNSEDVVIPEYVYDGETAYPVTQIGGVYNPEGSDANLLLSPFMYREDIHSIKFPSTPIRILGGSYCNDGWYVPTGAFQNCTNLEVIDWNGCEAKIEIFAFLGCTSLTTISNISGNIGDAFFGFTSLISVDLSSCTSIGDGAFSGCTSLSSVDLSSCTSIGNSAFNGCTSLMSVGDLSSCTSIGNYAFSGCTSLTSVGDLSSCSSIGNNAFYGWNVATLTLGNTIPSSNCTNFMQNDAPITFLVPANAVDSYRAAWSDFAQCIISKDAQTEWDVDVTMEENNSGVQTSIGENNLANVMSLKVTGDINSYDFFIFRNKMPNLHHLDLSDANVKASSYKYYGNYSTQDNVFPSYAFYQQNKLISIKLPKNTSYIGDGAFRSCTYLISVNLPEGIEQIRSDAFCNCNRLPSVQLPSTLRSIDSYAFAYCYKLNNVLLPVGLMSIGSYAFYQCSFSEIILPPNLTSIGYGAFGGCSNLRTVKASAIDPYSVGMADNSFEDYTNKILYVPYDEETGWDATYYAYYWHTQWGQFKVEKWKPTYTDVTINNDYEQDSGTIPSEEGEDIDAHIGTEGGYILGDDAEQEFGDVTVEGDGTSNGSIINGEEDNLSIDKLYLKIAVDADRWYFFSFPFDVVLSDITAPGEYVFRFYNSNERALGNSGWKNLETDEAYLKAGKGYIFRTNTAGTLVLPVDEPKFGGSENKSPQLVAVAASDDQDASWNFVGNPYLSYYELEDLDFDAPITIWTGNGYDALRAGDDDYTLQPYQAFFVQKPSGTQEVGFDPQAQETYQQSREKTETRNAKGEMTSKTKNADRWLVNLALYTGEQLTDKTRVVFNEKKTLDYEMDCDAAKFMSTDVPVQLWSTNDGKTSYSINERPAGSGEVRLCLQVQQAGTYRICAPRMDTPVVLKDLQNGITFDLQNGSYEFQAEAGEILNRFLLCLKNGANGIDEVNDNEGTSYYNLAGQQTGKAQKGVGIQKKGQKALKVLNK